MVLICLVAFIGTAQAISWTPTGYGCSTASDGTYSYAKFDIGTHSYTLIKNVTYYFEVIGGGGNGGDYDGGGGGAGGFRNFTVNYTKNTGVTIFVGKGSNSTRGWGIWNAWATTSPSKAGENSAILLPDVNITSLGGGYGGSSSFSSRLGQNGGSGSGGSANSAGGSGTAGQGRNGGAGSNNAGGGGGGNQTVGNAGSASDGGNGGKGTRSLISGENVSCGGGAGTNTAGSTVGYGGCWPDSLTAGNGSSTGNGFAGTAPGSGGGGAFGGSTGGYYSGSGANGTVMVRYITPPHLAVSFNANPLTGANPLLVTLNDTTTSSSAITAYNISLGAGQGWYNTTVFPATNISHLYSTAGNYTVDWYVSNAEGTGSASTTITVWGSVHSAFSLFNAAGTAPHTTYLYDQSTNLTPGPVTYLTDFGDGNSSTSANVYFTWNATGTYNVTHTVSNGLSSETSFTTVTVGTPTPPVVAPVTSFYGGPQTGNVPLTVFFTDVSSNTPTSWFWEFGDGSNSTLQNPNHTYTRSGFRTVNLTATNSAGSNVTTRVKFVRVN